MISLDLFIFIHDVYEYITASGSRRLDGPHFVRLGVMHSCAGKSPTTCNDPSGVRQILFVGVCFQLGRRTFKDVTKSQQNIIRHFIFLCFIFSVT